MGQAASCRCTDNVREADGTIFLPGISDELVEVSGVAVLREVPARHCVPAPRGDFPDVSPVEAGAGFDVPHSAEATQRSLLVSSNSEAEIPATMFEDGEERPEQPRLGQAATLPKPSLAEASELTPSTESVPSARTSELESGDEAAAQRAAQGAAKFRKSEAQRCKVVRNCEREAREGARVFLAAHGFWSVDAKQKCGNLGFGHWHPLHCAVKSGDARIVRMLLVSKANPHLTDSSGRTPYQFAMEKNVRGSHNEVLAALLEGAAGPERPPGVSKACSQSNSDFDPLPTLLAGSAAPGH